MEVSGAPPSLSLRMLFAEATQNPPLTPLLQHQGIVWSAAFSPDCTRVITASEDGTARVWDADSGKALSRPLRHQRSVYCATFSPDGTRVVTGSGDHTARVWDVASSRAVSPPLAHHDAVACAAFSPDGTRLITASFDNTMRVWDTASGKALSPPVQHKGSLYHGAFSPDCTRIVAVSARVRDPAAGKTTRVWDAGAGKAMRVWDAASGKTARIWDAGSGEPLSPPLPHKEPVVNAAFSPDGTRVVTASEDCTACIWDAASGKLLTPLAPRDPVTVPVSQTRHAHRSRIRGLPRFCARAARRRAVVWLSSSWSAEGAPWLRGRDGARKSRPQRSPASAEPITYRTTDEIAPRMTKVTRIALLIEERRRTGGGVGSMLGVGSLTILRMALPTRMTSAIAPANADRSTSDKNNSTHEH